MDLGALASLFSSPSGQPQGGMGGLGLNLSSMLGQNADNPALKGASGLLAAGAPQQLPMPQVPRVPQMGGSAPPMGVPNLQSALQALQQRLSAASMPGMTNPLGMAMPGMGQPMQSGMQQPGMGGMGMLGRPPQGFTSPGAAGAAPSPIVPTGAPTNGMPPWLAMNMMGMGI